jgi:uncharacterized protein
MGLEFFKRSLELQKKYQKPGTRIENTFQTNGILLDDEWCQFFHENNFLVGLSLDGPREFHDAYRKDRAGHGTFDRVVRAVRLLQKHNVEFNILCAVNGKNADHPLAVYKFFRDELLARYLQFIPIVERINPDGSTDCQEGSEVTDRSVSARQWGRFLVAIFDEWVRNDVGRTFVLNFDGALAGWLGQAGTICIFAPSCGLGLALEHNGDLYSCDHFVEPRHVLGNILTTPLLELVTSAQQQEFGNDKRNTLPQECLRCRFLHICNGECPKNRFVSRNGEQGCNYLCEGYKAFFIHADRPMAIMADLLRHGRSADEVMAILAADGHVAGPGPDRKPGRNDPCPCGSGMKFKKCHGQLPGSLP